MTGRETTPENREAPDLLSEAEIRRWLAGGSIGREIELHRELDSTNNRAKALAAAGAPHGTTVIAEAQTGGRGRMGRSFFSPAQTGVYMTMILRPECSPERAGMLTSLAAVAAARAVERVAGAEVQIKWVNDLYMGGRKICGILCEAGLGNDSGRLSYAVVGIGINTGKTEFPAELREIATSVGNETGTAPDRNRLIAEVMKETEALYGDLETCRFLEESRRRSNVLGREVTVIEGGRQYAARAVEIDEEGRLVIDGPEGRARLNCGEVSLKLAGRGRNT